MRQQTEALGSLLKTLQAGRARRELISLALIALVVFRTPLAVAWGSEGHTYVNRVAAQKLPLSMPLFLRRAVEELSYLGPEPDRWRSPTEFALKSSQEPDHFIDLERVSWLDPLPHGRYEFYRKLYEKRASTSEHRDDYLPEHVGLQPYITMEVYGRLKSAFRDYRQLRTAHKSTQSVEQAIIFYAGWLGHYVADGSQPLHTTVNYNGWTGANPNDYTTDHKIHALFETTYLAAHITPKDFSAFVKTPEQLDDPFAAYVAYLRNSNTLVQDVYAIEKSGGFTKGSAAAFDFTAHRLAAGSQMLLNLWYTAWKESAMPVPDHAPPASSN
jgi:S1/P1 Nuclease